jgi:hypothetical protein
MLNITCLYPRSPPLLPSRTEAQTGRHRLPFFALHGRRCHNSGGTRLSLQDVDEYTRIENYHEERDKDLLHGYSLSEGI